MKVIRDIINNKGFVTMVDGFEYFWTQSINTLMTSEDLRTAADELDRRNTDWSLESSLIYDKKVRERFDEKWMPEPNSGCYLWLGNVRKKENNIMYGRFNINGGQINSHRVAYEMTHGPIPKGLLVRHKCNNCICVNPAHLELGTHEDNMKDLAKSGRASRGSKSARAKLTEEEVTQIINDNRTSEQLSEIYGISSSHISAIKRGDVWSWLYEKIKNIQRIEQ